jgi:hypothetical protein
VDLWWTSTIKQAAKKLLSSLDNLSGFSRVPWVAIKSSALSGSSFKYGGSDLIISIAIIPSDQMSTFDPYSCLTTSGPSSTGFQPWWHALTYAL